MWRALAEADPEIAQAIRQETKRQNEGLELIASENFVSRAVLEAAGSVLTNKYAEAIRAAATTAAASSWMSPNVPPLRARRRCSQPNTSTFSRFGSAGEHVGVHDAAQTGDTVLGMNLAHGGHLTTVTR